MPELVACPSCGCRVQVSETQLGRRTRCIACQHAFVAGDQPPARAPLIDTYPVHPAPEEAPAPIPPAVPSRGPGRHRLPLCPGCHRPVGWDAPTCPFCGHLFDPLDGLAPAEVAAHGRRDGDDHRGRLIDTLGTISLVAGTLTLCTGPLGFLAALGTGIPAWVMADRDLPRMVTGMVDPQGRTTTEYGRNKAIVGVILASLFGAFFALWILSRL